MTSGKRDEINKKHLPRHGEHEVARRAGWGREEVAGWCCLLVSDGRASRIWIVIYAVWKALTKYQMKLIERARIRSEQKVIQRSELSSDGTSSSIADSIVMCERIMNPSLYLPQSTIT
jgi:hypothetical protein